MALDIGPADFAAANVRLRNMRRERARKAAYDANESFGHRQRETYERCVATEFEIGDAVATLNGIGELCMRSAEELTEKLDSLPLNLSRRITSARLATLIAEIVADEVCDGGEIVLRAVDLEAA